MSYSFKLKSHPSKLLRDHLKQVGKISSDIIKSKKIKGREFYSKIAYLIGISHDFGKGTSFFQLAVENGDKSINSHHSFLSAAFGYYLIKEYLIRKSTIKKEEYKFVPLITWIVILKHHGNLTNIKDELNTIGSENLKSNEEFEAAKRQIEDIKSNNLEEIKYIYKDLLDESGFRDLLPLIDNFIINHELYELLSEIYKTYKYNLLDNKNIDVRDEFALHPYFLTLSLYSALLDADKLDASNTKIPRRIESIPDDTVDRYKKVKFGNMANKIDEKREEIYQGCISEFRRINLNNHIFTLNLPTGAGKTLTGFSFALKLRKKIKKELGFTPRVIYSLPFLSIIDQNSSVLGEVLAEKSGIKWEDLFKKDIQKRETLLKEKTPSNLLLKHHHLAEIEYKTKKSDNEMEFLEVNKSLLLVEGWHSEIIITTFIQLFYSLITNRNRLARKFHNIINSIILLDEIQSIPQRYWLLLNKVLKYMADKFNCWIILMTATEPLIFNDKESIPIIKTKKRYFKFFDRIDYHFNLEAKDFTKFMEEFFDKVKSNNKNMMVVLNTISTAQNMYLYLKENLCKYFKVQDRDKNIDKDGILKLPGVELINLSTHIIPRERMQRISRIKNDKKRKIIITTQLIEAGVDISVDVIYRDLAPLDCIVQTAGRCNRNNESAKGSVTIVKLKSTKQEFWKYIYDDVLINATEDILNSIKKIKISEKEFNLEYIKEYYKKIIERGQNSPSKKILKNLLELNFAEIENFRLIEEKGRFITVFVEISKETRDLREKIQEIFESKKSFERYNKFIKFRKTLNEYTISIRTKRESQIEYLPTIGESEIRYIPYEDLLKIYKKDVGFFPSETSDFDLRCL